MVVNWVDRKRERGLKKGGRDKGERNEKKRRKKHIPYYQKVSNPH
jgi:hypothetical protein